MRKEHPAPYPDRPPLQFLVKQENSVLHETILKSVFFDSVGFFHCHSSHTRKHFSYQLLSQIAFS